jgi:hypothetical protein
MSLAYEGCSMATQTAPSPTQIAERAVGAVGMLATTAAVSGLIRRTVPRTSTAQTDPRPTVTSSGNALASVPGLRARDTGSTDWICHGPAHRRSRTVRLQIRGRDFSGSTSRRWTARSTPGSTMSGAELAPWRRSFCAPTTGQVAVKFRDADRAELHPPTAF